MAKKVMTLMDARTGMMQCRICGAVHFAQIKPESGGKYYRGAWQCSNGCKLPEEKHPLDLLEKTLSG
jgi:hypothetical protein